MIVVVDASVAAKWFFRFRNDELHVQQALAILAGIDDGRIRMLQPPHFIAEMAAVLAREKPRDAQADLADLMEMMFDEDDDRALYATACELAVRLNHHLFDTLYHAVALHTLGATLVTADRKYFDKAQAVGSIAYLSELSL
ncbi:MAG: type II toxin-antitoxin system VapC family toxin [Rhodocyclaceae bacterium]|nr:type II toxin-antitoxin system VapC family toxin [Rhodocyclaceae bacterium]